MKNHLLYPFLNTFFPRKQKLFVFVSIFTIAFARSVFWCFHFNGWNSNEILPHKCFNSQFHHHHEQCDIVMLSFQQFSLRLTCSCQQPQRFVASRKKILLTDADSSTAAKKLLSIFFYPSPPLPPSPPTPSPSLPRGF